MCSSWWLAQDPTSAGYHFMGWAVRVPDGRYLRKVHILRRTGAVLTSKDGEAMTWSERRRAQHFATKFKGNIGEVWEKERQRLLVWREQIPETRRLNPPLVLGDDNGNK